MGLQRMRRPTQAAGPPQFVMRELEREHIERYLQQVVGKDVTLLAIVPLGEAPSDGAALKAYGYGKPLRIDYRVAGERRSAVFHTMAPNCFGHEFPSDRAQALLWAHSAYNHLPRHVGSLDVGAFKADGTLASLGSTGEFFQITEYAEGRGYNEDLARLCDGGKLRHLDCDRADALCDYLLEIHSRPGPDPGLYTRRIRELLGHGECIMGLIDSFPHHPAVPASVLEEIERLCVQWRWKIKGLQHRLRQVHGDFHPWNILFSDGTEFRVLDRSRGEWGDPADDVTCITANYLFFSLRRSDRLEGPLGALFANFWRRYLSGSGSREILSVAAPFFAFRGLVLASPVWYPQLSDSIRSKILRFVINVLRQDAFDPSEVNRYLES